MKLMFLKPIPGSQSVTEWLLIGATLASLLMDNFMHGTTRMGASSGFMTEAQFVEQIHR